MGTSRIYPLTFSLRLHAKSKTDCESSIWLSVLERNMSHPLLENSLLLSSAWKYGNCQTCLDTRVSIPCLTLASTKCFRERSEKPVAGRHRIIPPLSSCFGEQHSQTHTNTGASMHNRNCLPLSALLLEILQCPVNTNHSSVPLAPRNWLCLGREWIGQGMLRVQQLYLVLEFFSICV